MVRRRREAERTALQDGIDPTSGRDLHGLVGAGVVVRRQRIDHRSQCRHALCKHRGMADVAAQVVQFQ
ncbi:MAG: hypothetical protein ABI678_06250, partial [Kofleriaceae bacterium]